MAISAGLVGRMSDLVDLDHGLHTVAQLDDERARKVVKAGGYRDFLEYDGFEH